MNPEPNEIQTFQITFDHANNVVTQYEEAAVSRGVSIEVRNYLTERMISHRMDLALVDDQTQALKIKGRILELLALLDLFKV